MLRWRCLRSSSVSVLYPFPRNQSSLPVWTIEPTETLTLSISRCPYTTVTSWFSMWHCSTTTPPYPVAHFFRRIGPAHMARIGTSVSCSRGKVSKSIPVWYPLNRSGETGELSGETRSQKVFLVTRSRALSRGKVTPLEEVAGSFTVVPVWILGDWVSWLAVDVCWPGTIGCVELQPARISKKVIKNIQYCFITFVVRSLILYVNRRERET